MPDLGIWASFAPPGWRVAGSLTAAREAAEILAGMDPVLREHILNAAAAAMVGKQGAQR